MLQNIIGSILLSLLHKVNESFPHKGGGKTNSVSTHKQIEKATTTLQWAISHDFLITFRNIAPFLNNINKTEIATATNNKKKGVHTEAEPLKISNTYHIIYRSHILYDRDSFYLSDIITKSSINMGKCSILFKNPNFFA